MQAYLIPQTGPQAGQRIPLQESIILGRTATDGVVVEDSAASRRHVEIVSRDGTFFWEDLNSTNGTFVNDKPMLEGTLQSGDRIRIGTTTVLFEVENGSSDATTGNISSLFKQTIMDSQGQVESSDDSRDTNSLLMAICSVMNEIATNYEPCSLVDKILQTTMKAISAQRGSVFFTGGGGDLRPCPVCNHIHTIRDGRLSHEVRSDISVSSTVAQRVIHGETVLFKDTGTDAELMKAESIMNMRLRSIICVPIRGKYGVLGILYIDSDRADTQYTSEHLMLSTAVGNSAGLALENARMHQAMLDKQRIEQEIEYAASIQEGFLVKAWPDDDARFRVYGEMRPAKTVGGDFYDFIRPDEDTVGILIGDVSGKGVPAALAMAQLLAEFRAQSAKQKSPEAVLSAMNASFVEKSKRGMFCTLCYLTVDLRTGEVTSANAGHHPVIHTTGGKAIEVEAASGLPIGIIAEEKWPDSTFSMSKGDTIVLYTDGIIEARGVQTQSGTMPASDGQEYSVEQLLSLLSLRHEKNPQDLAGAVLEDVRRYCEPARPHDDCTLISFRYLG